MDAISNFFVTGASGQLGRIVVQLLADRGFNVIAGMRDPAKGADLAALGAEVRAFDYDNPASLASALAGTDRLLLISSSEVGKRVTQHQAVIDAACTAGVAFIAYTSILRATETPIGLASEHRATEALIQQSGIAHAFLRNGWYCENFMMGLTPAIQHGALMTCASQARFSAATRADFAAMPLLMSVDSAKMRTFVEPEAVLDIEAFLEHDGSGFAVVKAKITSAGKKICDAQLKLRTIPFDQVPLGPIVKKRAGEVGLLDALSARPQE